MSSKSIFLVWGSTGEWGDRVQWRVAAFSTKEAAEAFCSLCQEKADVFYDNHSDKYYENRDELDDLHDELVEKYEKEGVPYKEATRRAKQEGWARFNPYDPHMQVDYTGTKYQVEEILLDPVLQ